MAYGEKMTPRQYELCMINACLLIGLQVTEEEEIQCDTPVANQWGRTKVLTRPDLKVIDPKTQKCGYIEVTSCNKLGSSKALQRMVAEQFIWELKQRDADNSAEDIVYIQVVGKVVEEIRELMKEAEENSKDTMYVLLLKARIFELLGW